MQPTARRPSLFAGLALRRHDDLRQPRCLHPGSSRGKTSAKFANAQTSRQLHGSNECPRKAVGDEAHPLPQPSRIRQPQIAAPLNRRGSRALNPLCLSEQWFQFLCLPASERNQDRRRRWEKPEISPPQHQPTPGTRGNRRSQNRPNRSGGGLSYPCLKSLSSADHGPRKAARPSPPDHCCSPCLPQPIQGGTTINPKGVESA